MAADRLDDACGHHCGVNGLDGARRVGHCPCPDCHGMTAQGAV